MTLSQEQAGWFAQTFSGLADNIEHAIIGKRHVVELVLTAMISEGHVLLEDVPGTGKTSLARALAQSVQGTTTRIQFTPDLLPGDVTGITVYDQKTGEFEFHAGPVFAMNCRDFAAVGELAGQHIDEGLLLDRALQSQGLGTTAEPLARLRQFRGRVVVVLGIVFARPTGGADCRKVDHLPDLTGGTWPRRYSAGTSQSCTP